MLSATQQLNDYLSALIPKIKFSKDLNLKLERISRLLALLDNPQEKFTSIHVAGSAGKGSTSTMISSILIASGFKTGLHTSPHLQLLNERHQINGKVVPTSDLLRLFEQMIPAIEQVEAEMPQYGKPSYFEAQFALSCLWFAEQQVDVAVVEVGLGGRLDGTNVLPAAVSVITNIGLDHTEILGDTIEAIASEKAGIIKPHQIVVTGATQPSVRHLIEARCDEFGIPCWKIDRQFMVIDGEDHFHLNLFGREIDNLSVPLLGQFQRTNAAVATAAALAFAGNRLTADAIRTGLQKICFPGRLEQVQSNPTVILDGAHNPDKMKASRNALQNTGKTIVVMGLKAGKDLENVVRQVASVADEMIATQFLLKGLWSPYPADAIGETARLYNPTLPITIVENPLDAVALALEKASPEDTIWITGSLYLVGDVREIWYPIEQLVLQAETAEGLVWSQKNRE